MLSESSVIASKPSRRRIVRAVSAATGIPVQLLISERRDRYIVRARHVAMYLGNEVFGYSLSQVGHSMNRDHTSVLHGVRAIKGFLAEQDAWVSRAVTYAQELIGSGERINPPMAPAGPEPIEPTEEPSDDLAARDAEMKSLRSKGWSIYGLARRYDEDPREIAGVLGEPWPGSERWVRLEGAAA